jgi:hypothetical protein
MPRCIFCGDGVVIFLVAAISVGFVMGILASYSEVQR